MPHGLRGGIGLGVLGLFAIAFVTWVFGRILEGVTTTETKVLLPEIGLGLTTAVGVALLYFGCKKYFGPGSEELFKSVEDQGWFSWNVYKASQGQRVRRGTVLGILIIFGCGIYTMLSHQTLETLGYTTTLADGKVVTINDWTATLPFMGGAQITLLHHARFALPLLLTLFALWLAFRVVNFPTFADFLIATEAELNKVSWTTKKRLWQDTIVVLVTTVLLTVFLWLMDIIWSQLLIWLGVIRLGS